MRRTRIASAWGRTDIVVNNAGYAKRTPVQDINDRGVRRHRGNQHAQRLPQLL